MVQKACGCVFERALDEGDEGVVDGERGDVEDYVDGGGFETPDDAFVGAGDVGVGCRARGDGGFGVAVVGNAGVRGECEVNGMGYWGS